ncbi:MULTISPECIES: sigma-70 family RNA polymerase sigma factor [Methylobacterium]|jgi:RNA polymerase sigma factor (sigma-70 family)|uniref:RNA polymerase sigma factor n=2 Tax=Methylobacterium TaxID=407 RepID=A0A0C6FQW5_9HYPH|nr:MULTISPECIES: sigma-70 family RNA polymerase sigma factor [Methylobacterium]MBK3395450.1 sigma-70 family RNA polymerase sigma factor [Methylobacterium ajmalii]MBK3412163.1 sigma-70 family RNA polymerase sigma factor [Methylobacterium ajmalii]MBK3422522.1 sigma-70 family RNA polymerase sigma factor [Methylobacterium ajmalii]MBZ6413033.1 sigma-70 family RNA polymerase sigma factor [Methylobacterium sp.]SFF60922.1 RNA polymerase, sigma subunit, ECF family [Methylobacterium sp. yr596]
MVRVEDRLTRDRPDDEAAVLADLIALVATGRQDALRALYDRTAPKLFGLILRIVRDRGAAEDVLQDAYLRVWQGAAGYAPEAGRPMAWLAAIARHRAIDLVRRRGEVTMPAGEDDEEDWLARIADPRDSEAEFLDRDALLACLGRLEPAQRDCIVLAYCEGLSREELAARYDRPVNTVKTWLHRGLASLRGCLDAVA